MSHSIKKQKGFIALFLVALLALGFSLVTGAILAHLKANGTITESTLSTTDTTQQNKVIDDKKRVAAWYANNAYTIDSQTGQPNLPTILSQAGIVLGGEQAAVSNRILANGVGYHVFAFWYPPTNPANVGLDVNTGVFNIGTGNTTLAYSVFSGFSTEVALWQQTDTNLQRIANSLQDYYSIQQQQNDPDSTANVNWFRSSTCATTGMALPCYDTDTAISATTLQSMIGLSDSDMITGWTPNTNIVVNNASTATLPPYSMQVKSTLPWGTTITKLAVSN